MHNDICLDTTLRESFLDVHLWDSCWDLIAGAVFKAITVAGEFCKEKSFFFFSQYDGGSEYWIKNESV